MNFIGTGVKYTATDLQELAALYGLTPVHIQTVMAVETNGAGYDVKKRLVILPEPHIFYARLSNPGREQAIDEGLAYAKQGTKPYDKTQDLRYQRLERMLAIDKKAAFDSVSYGLPQMMGFNHTQAGYDSSERMIPSYLVCERIQIGSMLKFMKANDLIRHLQNQAWDRFAKGYNGPAYAKNQYDVKLKRYWTQFSAGAIKPSTDPLSDGMLSIGDRGDVVIELQETLTKLGFDSGGHDGAFGKLTEQAVIEFQRHARLGIDGKVGRKTAKALDLDWAKAA